MRASLYPTLAKLGWGTHDIPTFEKKQEIKAAVIERLLGAKGTHGFDVGRANGRHDAGDDRSQQETADHDCNDAGVEWVNSIEDGANHRSGGDASAQSQKQPDQNRAHAIH